MHTLVESRVNVVVGRGKKDNNADSWRGGSLLGITKKGRLGDRQFEIFGPEVSSSFPSPLPPTSHSPLFFFSYGGGGGGNGNLLDVYITSCLYINLCFHSGDNRQQNSGGGHISSPFVCLPTTTNSHCLRANTFCMHWVGLPRTTGVYMASGFCMRK